MKSSAGTSIFPLLGLLFIALKLCHVIDWSWLWVLAPFWGGFVLVVIVLMACIAIAVAIAVAKEVK